mgnify:CR=1 FL=1
MSMVKKSFKVNDMHCTSCAMVIEAELEDAGVKAKCNFVKSVLEVEYDETKLSEDKIRYTVIKAGYTISSS